jgi:hypothetical protein
VVVFVSGTDGLIDACVSLPVDDLMSLEDQIKSTSLAVHQHQQDIIEQQVRALQYA